MTTSPTKERHVGGKSKADSEESSQLTLDPRPRISRPLRSLLRNRPAMFGAFILMLLLVMAAWPVSLLPHDPFKPELVLRFTPPSWLPGGLPGYLLGTEVLGRDVLSMIVAGTRYTLGIVSLATVGSFLLGVPAGLVSGYFGGWSDSVLMRMVDIQLAFPTIVLIIAVVAVLGPSFWNIVFVLGFVGWARYARIVRGTVLSLREKEFVEAARAIGATNLRIIIRHLLPNIVTPLVIFTTFQMAELFLVEAALAFLGLGIQPPTPSWGGMIADGRQYLFTAWWVTAIPGLVISASVLSFNFLGDGLRDAFDPTSSR